MPQVKLLYLSILLAACAHHPKPLPTAVEGELSLIVNISGIICCEGVLKVAVYNDAAFWKKDEGMVRGHLFFAENKSERLEIHGLTPGNYAIAIFQDINANQILDKKLFFIPAEPFGFSGTNSKYRPPSFTEARISLQRSQDIFIQLHHF